MPEKIIHVDRLDFGPSWMTKKFEKTPEGFLVGRAIVTSTGVFTYRDELGKIVRELRLPEEVFRPDSVESLKMLPVTNDHPPELVTAENIKKYQVGFSGDNPSKTTQFAYATNDADVTDGYHLAVDLKITDSATIDEIIGGKQALSCGYTTDLEPAEPDSMWCGIPYDYIQRNIVYNHVSIVDSARAGDAARIRLDSVDPKVHLLVREEEKPMPDMKKINLDGVEYEAEAKVIEVLAKRKERIDTLETEVATKTTELSALQGKFDNATEQASQLTQKVADLEKSQMNADAVNEKVKALLKVREVAGKVGVEVKDEMSEDEIKRAVILKQFPSAQLDGKDVVYVTARFDAIAESLVTEAHNDAQVDTLKGVQTVSETASTDARKRMLDEQFKRSRNQK